MDTKMARSDEYGLLGILIRERKMEGGQAENGKIVHLLTRPGLQRRVLECWHVSTLAL